MSNEYILRINDNKSLTDSEGSTVSWISGKLSFPESNKMPAPNIFKILSANPDLQGVTGIDIKLDIDKELYMLPLDYDSGVFFGADYISGRFLYGEKKLIEAAEQELEEAIIESTKDHDYPAENNPSVVAVWHLDNNKSLLTFHHDSYNGFDFPDSITERKILDVPCGYHVDDMSADYMLTTIIYKWIKKIGPKDKTNMEDFESSEDYDADADTACYVTFNNDEYTVKQKDLFIGLSKTLFCDFMHWHEASAEEAAENRVEPYVLIAKKLQEYTKKG